MVAGVVVVLVLLAAGAFWWLHGNAEELIRQTIEREGSRLTGAPVSVASVSLSASDGRGEIRDLTLGNPPGFRTPHALRVDRIELELAPLTLAQSVVRVRRIAVVAPDVVYERGESLTNFDTIARNVSAALGPADKQAAPGKKLIVEHVDLTGARAQASAALMGGKTVTIALPDIHLKDIGKDKGGVTPGELSQIIAGAMQRKLSGAYSFDQALKATGAALGKAGSAIKGLFK